MRNFRQILLALGISVATLAMAPTAKAAETVVLRYGLLRGSLPVQDLTNFAETGETSGRLRRYLRLGNQEPEQFRQYLTETAQVAPNTLNLILATPAGDVLLDEMSEYLYVPNHRNNAKNLKAAITTSVADDERISLLELLQNYPTERVHINVRKAVSTYQQFASIQERFSGILNGRLGDLLRTIGSP